ncbi:MFS-type transporter involved in bile tolerance (Atg22 family) [Pseudomonas sp. JUb42]|uniref:hypothetical protein n=1 Tax=Pseudomonas sp. JUb42 TaxID=2940611 RepID=UPI002169329E|nr:hypothetical protein [Pseudomonas sp. JUb42]MCS3467410.1 MFS-type transporter involved in bile tolerance (Atg22 family) [Pseudomonas sp. JUb42]
MITLASGFQIVAAIGSVVFTYVRLTHAQRAEAKTLLYRGTAVLSAIAVGLASITNVIGFGISDAPLTRHDVLWLLLNIWNAIAYAGCGIGLAAYWYGQNQKAKAVSENQQPANEP